MAEWATNEKESEFVDAQFGMVHLPIEADGWRYDNNRWQIWILVVRRLLYAPFAHIIALQELVAPDYIHFRPCLKAVLRFFIPLLKRGVVLS